jgi:lipopolysaccharide transport system permease protein
MTERSQLPDGYIEITPGRFSRTRHKPFELLLNLGTYVRQAAFLARATLAERTFGRSLGALWLVLDPVLQSAVLFFILSFVFSIRGSDVSFLSIYLSVVFWRPTLNLISMAPTLLTSRATILQQTNFPIVLILLETIFVELVMFAINLSIVVALLFWSGRPPGVAWLLLPIPFAVQLIFTLAVMIGVTGIGTLIRDVSALVAAAMTVVFYASPILYNMDRIPEPWRTLLYAVNPLTHIIPTYRTILIDNAVPVLWPLLIVAVVSAAVVALELRVLETARHRFYQFL